MPRKQTQRQPNPGPSGTRWSEDLYHKPTQHNEAPIPGPSPSSEPPEDIATCEPEPQVAPTQSMEEPFARHATPHSVIIIADMPIGSPPPIYAFLTLPSSTTTPDLPPTAAESPTPSSTLVASCSHSYDDACQEFTDLQPTLITGENLASINSN
ncbi:hypothetical protein O181_040577 [Austropuccinia psidii MF-1]|uniref:Uncharacterized protein n=1 Tax=Austropuccinia psidii MF-1 TaxID=1389203 RepID=A0A9Q3HE11_9BASI|nr:hypothetical protein [Austropuccinia psidii MF-1]